MIRKQSHLMRQIFVKVKTGQTVCLLNQWEWNLKSKVICLHGNAEGDG